MKARLALLAAMSVVVAAGRSGQAAAPALIEAMRNVDARLVVVGFGLPDDGNHASANCK